MEEYNIEKAYAGDFIGIRGTVKIENGEHVAIGRNHWVAQGLETIGAFLINTVSESALVIIEVIIILSELYMNGICILVLIHQLLLL